MNPQNTQNPKTPKPRESERNISMIEGVIIIGPLVLKLVSGWMVMSSVMKCFFNKNFVSFWLSSILMVFLLQIGSCFDPVRD